MPGNRSFGPLGSCPVSGKVVTMTLDEFEAIRLIDLDGLNQEECANLMGVARTTAQAIYNSARSKLAECLVNGVELSVSGGDIILCEESRGCGGSRCQKRKCRCGGEFEESGEKKNENSGDL